MSPLHVLVWLSLLAWSIRPSWGSGGEQQRLDSLTLEDAAALAALSRQVPAELGDYPVVSLLYAEHIRIDDEAVTRRLIPAGRRPSFERQQHAIDLVRDPVRSGHAHFSFSYDSRSSTLRVLEKRRIRPDGSFLRLDDEAVQDEFLDTGGLVVRYRRRRAKRLTLRDVRAGDLTELRNLQTCYWKLPGQGYASSYHFGGRTPMLEERVCYEMSQEVPFHWQLSDPEGTVETEFDEQSEIKRYCFVRRDQPPRPVESAAPGDFASSPVLHVSTWSDWKPLSSWVRLAYRGKFKPDDGMRALVGELGADLGREDALRAIYHWLLENVEHVAVAPKLRADATIAPAAEVFKRRYGDSRELATLLVSLLAARDIHAWPVLLASQDNPDADLQVHAPTQFDHVITWVEGLDRYLDPSNDQLSYPYLAPAAQGRRGFLLRRGRLIPVRTPVMAPEDALRSRRLQLALRVDEERPGRLELVRDGELRFSGPRAAAWRRRRDWPDQRLDEFMRQQWAAGGRVESWSLDHPLATFSEPVVLRARRADAVDDVAWAGGERPAYILLPRFTGVPGTAEICAQPSRRLPYVWAPQPQLDELELALTIPQGYRLAHLPEPVEHEHPGDVFSYSLTYAQEDRQVLLRERFRLARPLVAPQEFEQLRQALEALQLSAANRLMLVAEQRGSP